MKINESKIINTYNFLIRLKGNNSATEKHVLDKHIFISKSILSIKFGLIIYLLLTLIKRRYKLNISKNNYLNSNEFYFKKQIKPDNLIKSSKINFSFFLKRTLIALRITHVLRKYINDNIIDKYLSSEFIWYLSCLYSDSIYFKCPGILLNGELSAQELAILAFVNDKLKVNFLMPIYWRYENQYYAELARYSNRFIVNHPYDAPSFLRKNNEIKIIQYKPRSFVFNIKNRPCIGLFLTTFKNYENKRFKIVTQSIKDIFDKYGRNVDLVVKPHPYEYELFKNNKNLKNFNIEIAKDNQFFKKIDFCFVPQSTVIFEIILHGIPLIILRQIDVYYLFDFAKDDFYDDELIPKFQDIKSSPDYLEIINLYKSKKRGENIQKLLIGH